MHIQRRREAVRVIETAQGDIDMVGLSDEPTGDGGTAGRAEIALTPFG